MSLGKKRMGRSATDPSTNPLSTKTLNRKEPKKCGVGVGVQGAGNPTLPERKEETDTGKAAPKGQPTPEWVTAPLHRGEQPALTAAHRRRRRHSQLAGPAGLAREHQQRPYGRRA